MILALAACLAPVAAQSAQQRQGDRALPTPQDDVTSDEATEGSHAASSTGSRRKPQLSMAWREDAAWLWTQVGAVVENPVASPRDVATAALGAAGMGLDVGSKNPDPVIGVRGDTLLRAQRPHATAPLLVIHDFLTRRESDKLVLATNQVPCVVLFTACEGVTVDRLCVSFPRPLRRALTRLTGACLRQCDKRCARQGSASTKPVSTMQLRLVIRLVMQYACRDPQ